MSHHESNIRGPEISIDADWNRQYINGEWRCIEERERIEVENPATGELITEVPAASVEDVDEAYDAATTAQVDWAETPPQERARIVRRVGELMEEHEKEIREILAIEGGSTVS